MFAHEEGERIVIKPIPSLDKLHGIHVGDRESGEVLEKVRELKDEEKQREDERVERLPPSDDEDGEE